MDYKNLDPELVKKLTALEKKQPVWQQLRTLQDIASISHEMLNVLDGTKSESSKQLNDLGAALLDTREQLIKLNAKKDPQTPDFTPPVVAAINNLITKLDSKDFNPTIKVGAPLVNVPTPIANVQVDAPKVDTKGIEKAVKELKVAFNEAIAQIPPTIIPEQPDRWSEVIDWLKSIDTASRLKPVVPNQLKVVNPDNSYVGVNLVDSPYDYVSYTNADGLGNYRTWTYKIGGAGGTTVRTLAVTFDGSSNVTSITRT